jgi:hypothetical protein
MQGHGLAAVRPFRGLNSRPVPLARSQPALRFSEILPVAKKSTSVAKKSCSVAEKSCSVAKKSTSVAKKFCSVAKKCTSGAKKSTSVAEKSCLIFEKSISIPKNLTSRPKKCSSVLRNVGIFRRKLAIFLRLSRLGDAIRRGRTLYRRFRMLNGKTAQKKFRVRRRGTFPL